MKKISEKSLHLIRTELIEIRDVMQNLRLNIGPRNADKIIERTEQIDKLLAGKQNESA